MNGKEAIRDTLNLSHFVLTKYLGDLSDADLLKRPGPGCNHVAWQLGHLIASESSLLNGIRAGAGPELPAGFAAWFQKGVSKEPRERFGSAREMADELKAVLEA